MRTTKTIEAIDKAMISENAKDPVRYHLGYSLIGNECTRQLWYTFRWVDSPSHSGRLLRLFQRGHLEEERFVYFLEKAGIQVWATDENGQQFKVAPEECGGHFGGSTDGVGLGFPEDPQAPMLIEMKTHSGKSFKDLEKNGVAVSKPQHLAQMQGYCHQMNLPKAFYMAVNKDNDDLYTEVIEADTQAAEGLIARAKQIITSDRPLQKMSQDPTFFRCKWCDFHGVCHNIKPPKFNCRTCVHATAELDGDARWGCEKHNKSLSGQDQIAACDSHLFIPDLLENWAKPVDSNEEEGFVEYENIETGKRFRNGSGGFLSREIAAAGDIRVFGDELAETLRENFGAEVVG